MTGPHLSSVGTHGAGVRLEPMEATNGILVAGLNTAILFAILSSVARRHGGYHDLLQ